jgi:ketosteroid isomerase-like protein
MKRISLFLVLSIAVDAQSNDNAAIAALYQQFANAFRHKDLNAIMLSYVHDGTLFDVGTPREHVGWDDYRTDWKGG